MTEAAGQQPIEVDHDLLTLGIAGARLQAEVDELRRRLARIDAGEADLGDTAEASLQAQRRLQALTDGVLRNTLCRINDDNRREFFGFS
jgi:hypothetical protein